MSKKCGNFFLEVLEYALTDDPEKKLDAVEQKKAEAKQ